MCSKGKNAFSIPIPNLLIDTKSSSFSRRWRLLAGQERGYKIACLRWALFTTYNRPVTVLELFASSFDCVPDQSRPKK